METAKLSESNIDNIRKDEERLRLMKERLIDDSEQVKDENIDTDDLSKYTHDADGVQVLDNISNVNRKAIFHDLDRIKHWRQSMEQSSHEIQTSDVNIRGMHSDEEPIMDKNIDAILKHLPSIEKSADSTNDEAALKKLTEIENKLEKQCSSDTPRAVVPQLKFRLSNLDGDDFQYDQPWNPISYFEEETEATGGNEFSYSPGKLASLFETNINSIEKTKRHILADTIQDFEDSEDKDDLNRYTFESESDIRVLDPTYEINRKAIFHDFDRLRKWQESANKPDKNVYIAENSPDYSYEISTESVNEMVESDKMENKVCESNKVQNISDVSIKSDSNVGDLLLPETQTLSVLENNMSKAEKVAPTELSKTENVAPTELSKTENVAPTELSVTENVASTELSKTENVAPTELSVTENVAPTELSKTENVASTELSKTENMTLTELSDTESVDVCVIKMKQGVDLSSIPNNAWDLPSCDESAHQNVDSFLDLPAIPINANSLSHDAETYLITDDIITSTDTAQVDDLVNLAENIVKTESSEENIAALIDQSKSADLKITTSAAYDQNTDVLYSDSQQLSVLPIASFSDLQDCSSTCIAHDSVTLKQEDSDIISDVGISSDCLQSGLEVSTAEGHCTYTQQDEIPAVKLKADDVDYIPNVNKDEMDYQENSNNSNSTNSITVDIASVHRKDSLHCLTPDDDDDDDDDVDNSYVVDNTNMSITSKPDNSINSFDDSPHIDTIDSQLNPIVTKNLDDVIENVIIQETEESSSSRDHHQHEQFALTDLSSSSYNEDLDYLLDALEQETLANTHILTNSVTVDGSIVEQTGAGSSSSGVEQEVISSTLTDGEERVTDEEMCEEPTTDRSVEIFSAAATANNDVQREEPVDNSDEGNEITSSLTQQIEDDTPAENESEASETQPVTESVNSENEMLLEQPSVLPRSSGLVRHVRFSLDEEQEERSLETTESPMPSVIEPQPENSEEMKQLGWYAPKWIPDTDAKSCMKCGLKFTVVKRRHHCRACGKVLCSQCCNMKFFMPYMDYKPSRVCQTCCDIMVSVLNCSRDPVTSSLPSATSTITTPSFPSSSILSSSATLLGSLPEAPPPYSELVDGGGHIERLDSNTSDAPPYSELPTSSTASASCSSRFVEQPAPVITAVQAIENLPVMSQGSGPGSPIHDMMNFQLPAYTPTIRPRSHRNRSESEMSAVIMFNSTVTNLPPILRRNNEETRIVNNPDLVSLFNEMKDDEAEPISFIVNKNLVVRAKVINMDCCVDKRCWCFSSDGMGASNQEEIVILIKDSSTDLEDLVITRKILQQMNSIFEKAKQGNAVSELEEVEFDSNMLFAPKNAGMLFFKPTLQCTKKLLIPASPYLVGLYIETSELPWAKNFPLRLLLRIGAEFKYYPCPLFNVLDRAPVYNGVGRTILDLLADFRNYQYTIPRVAGVTINLRGKDTIIKLPQHRYDEMIKALNASEENVLSLAGNFSSTCDGHLVSVEKDGKYKTQTLSIVHKENRKVTCASFVVISAALKPSIEGIKAKASIVEDGVMIQVTTDVMKELKKAIKDMKEYTVIAGDPSTEDKSVVGLEWCTTDVIERPRLLSPIDATSFDNLTNMKIRHSYDYTSNNLTAKIHWVEVYFLPQDNDTVQRLSARELGQMTSSIAKSCMSALSPYLMTLIALEMTRIGLRVNLAADFVEYKIGAKLSTLPTELLPSLDDKLVPAIHGVMTNAQERVAVELIFQVVKIV